MLPRATFLVSNGHNIVACNLVRFTANEADMLPLETDPVAHDNNIAWTLKPGQQSFLAPTQLIRNGNRTESVCNHASDNKIGRPRNKRLTYLSRIWLLTEVDDMKCDY